jgi:transcriptional regulator with XRE-family HTH domain
MRYSQRGYRRRPRARMDSTGPMRDDVRVTDRDLKRLADAIKDARGKLGVTQDEFARRAANLSLPNLQRLEKAAVNNPQAKTLSALDEAAGWEPGSARGVLEYSRPPKTTRNIPTVDELASLTLLEILKVLDRAEELSGKAAREQLRDDIAAYLNRHAENTPSVSRMDQK